MNAILAMILSWQFIFLSIGLAIAVYTVRTIVEYFILNNPHLPGTKDSTLWRSLILPLMPIGFGVIFSFLAHKFPYDYPDGVNTANAQLIFCLAAGALSSVVFRVIKELLLANINPTNLNPSAPYININQGPMPIPTPQIAPGPPNSTQPPPVNQPVDNGHGVDPSNN